MYLINGTPLARKDCLMAQVLSGAIEMATDEQVIIERLDGFRGTVIVNIRPLRDSRGEIASAINCFYQLSHTSFIPASAKL